MHARYSDNSPSQTVVFGDELAGFIRKPRSPAAIETKAEELITDLKSSILYKDSDIIVINKQSEVSVHDDSFGSDPSFQDIQKAVTDVTILKSRTLASLVCLEPQTGRKHQLRVHMASLSSFILGDFKYGIGCTKQFAHQVSDPLKIPLHLHLRQITLKNWFGDGKDLSVSAPLPGFWQKTLLSSGHDPNDADIPLQASLNK
ncbi:Mitochondrial RNA pseudouridine synthase rpusd4 [Kappamyces sp. JEL0680]|nr:Mitochondrial RNA pseudouridine synthase rpusd4 [Kappamyces sp. JEL0680]